MGLFPQSFIEDVRAAADIVVVVQDTVALRRVGQGGWGLARAQASRSRLGVAAWASGIAGLSPRG